MTSKSQSTHQDVLHGYPVIHASPCYGTRKRRVVLVFRGDDDDTDARFVTAIHEAGDESWLWGHYIPELPEALDDFNVRAAKLVAREALAGSSS